jgi:glycosyltransferase involved in cell wall biosynthesis
VRYLGEASHEGCIAYMQQADIIINASRDDPFPVVLIEALCLGKTCILSSHTGTAELVQQGVNGFVFEQENSRELASLLAAILKNPSLLTGIGLQARITYQTQLTLEQFGQGWLQYLETLKTGRRLPYPSAKKRLIHEQTS